MNRHETKGLYPPGVAGHRIKDLVEQVSYLTEQLKVLRIVYIVLWEQLELKA